MVLKNELHMMSRLDFRLDFRHGKEFSSSWALHMGCRMLVSRVPSIGCLCALRLCGCLGRKDCHEAYSRKTGRRTGLVPSCIAPLSGNLTFPLSACVKRDH